MSTVHFVFGTVLAALLTLSSGPSSAQEGPIRPYKDDLFSRMTVLQSADGGAHEVLDYQEMRDINERDREPERRVKDAYISTDVRRYQENETLQVGGRKLDVTRVGPQQNAAFTVIFIHGRGGDRRLGANDYTFGGNFNRLKNLVVGNGGTYYAPSVTSFDEKGFADVAALIRHAFEQSSRPAGYPRLRVDGGHHLSAYQPRQGGGSLSRRDGSTWRTTRSGPADDAVRQVETAHLFRPMAVPTASTRPRIRQRFTAS